MRARLAKVVRTSDAVERGPRAREPREDLVGQVQADKAGVAGRDGEAPLEEETDGVRGEVDAALYIDVSRERLDGVGEAGTADAVMRE